MVVSEKRRVSGVTWWRQNCDASSFLGLTRWRQCSWWVATTGGHFRQKETPAASWRQPQGLSNPWVVIFSPQKCACGNLPNPQLTIFVEKRRLRQAGDNHRAYQSPIKVPAGAENNKHGHKRLQNPRFVLKMVYMLLLGASYTPPARHAVPEPSQDFLNRECHC